MSVAIQSRQTAQVALTALASESSSRPTSAPVLMPEPQPMSDAGGDPMAVLYELISKQRNNDTESGKAGVEHNRELQKAQQVKEEADFKKQEDAAQSAKVWGIFGKVASLVAVAVSAVAAVFSCGAASALCVAACILSAAAFAEGESHVLLKLTNNPDVEKAFQLGCGIGAALCSGGAGIAATGAGLVGQVAEVAGAAAKVGQEVVSNVTTDKGWGYVAMGLGMAGAAGDMGFALSSAIKGAASVATAAADTAKSGATLVEGAKVSAAVVSCAAGTAAGVGTIVSSQFDAASIDFEADAKQAQMRIAHLQQLVEWAVDGIKETDKSHERALKTLSGAIQTKGQTLAMASAMRV